MMMVRTMMLAIFVAMAVAAVAHPPLDLDVAVDLEGEARKFERYRVEEDIADGMYGVDRVCESKFMYILSGGRWYMTCPGCVVQPVDRKAVLDFLGYPFPLAGLDYEMKINKWKKMAVERFRGNRTNESNK